MVDNTSYFQALLGSALISVSLCHLCVLRDSVVNLTGCKRLTTKTQRTQRTHRDFNLGHYALLLIVAFAFVTCLTGVTAIAQQSPSVAPSSSQTSSQEQKPTTTAPATIELNLDDPIATTSDISPLSVKLREVFKHRVEQHAYALGMEMRSDLPEAERIEKTVFIRADRSISLAEFMKVVEAVADAGAPVLLPLQEKAPKFDWMGMKWKGKPNPLVLLVRLRQPNSPRPLIMGVPSVDDVIISGGIPIVLAGVPKGKSVAAISIAKDGEYYFGEERVEKAVLANAIQSRINKPGADKFVFVKVAPDITYGSLEDLYHAASTAGAKRLYLDSGGRTITWVEQNISVTVPAGWRKGETWDESSRSFRLKGAENASLSVGLGYETDAVFSPENELARVFENMKVGQKEGRYEEVRYLEIDGVKGLLSRSVDKGEQTISWIAFRKRGTKLQYVQVFLSTSGPSFNRQPDELYNILSSIKLNQR